MTSVSRISWIVANLAVLAFATVVFLLVAVGLGMAEADYASIHPELPVPQLRVPNSQWAMLGAAVADIPAVVLLGFGHWRLAWVAGLLPYTILSAWITAR